MSSSFSSSNDDDSDASYDSSDENVNEGFRIFDFSSSDDDESSGCCSTECDVYDSVIVDYINRQKLDGLKRLREEVDWESKKERARVFWQIYFLISDWNKARCPNTPNLRDVFQPAEIERLLVDAVMDRFRGKDNNYPGQRFIKFVARCGYKDEPRPAELPSSRRRTTAVLHEAKRQAPDKRNIVELFKIYDWYDVNYVDEESGLTHFHVACKFGLHDVVQQFLELGQDANCLPQTASSIDPPLILALDNDELDLCELLLEHGADPNAVNAEGLTPLLISCEKTSYMPMYNFSKMLLDIGDEKYQPVRIDVRDKSGLTPLHLVLLAHDRRLAELLLSRGADPNLPCSECGSTPLHIICKRDVDDSRDETENRLLETFFGSCERRKLTVLIDAKDNEGRTPLQMAVANLLPRVVDVLLDRGADLSNFVFPTEAHFDARFRSSYRNRMDNVKLRLASCTMMVIDSLEKRGYEPKRADALTVVKLFTKYGLLEKSSSSSSPENRWYDDPNLAEKAKRVMMKDDHPSPSLYDLIQLRPEEAAKELTPADYLEFALENDDFYPLSDEEHIKACTLHMCEKLSRGFFRAWAVECFMELTRYQLPIECCEIIVDDSLANRNLCNICLAVTIE